MKNVWTIIKKDLRRYFTDKRILIGLFLPGIIIFVMYSIMGNFLTDALLPGENESYTVYVQNLPDELSALIAPEDMNVTLVETDGSNIEEIKQSIREGNVSAYVVFSEHFISSLGSEYPPQVKIYFSSADTPSTNLYSYYVAALDAFEDSQANLFDVNSGTEVYDCATQEDVSTMLITMLMPMLLMIFLWSGCMMVSTESIAGEKERGTIATLLVTPVKRANIAIGKIIGLSITSLASAVCSFIGVMLSLPSLFSGMDVSLDIYNAGTYLALLAVIVITVLLFTIILLMISTYAKSVKEATSISSTAMILILLVAISSMMGSAAENPLLYLIPVYNCSQCFSALLSLTFNPINLLITVVSNAVAIALGIWCLTKMFNSERVMFHK